MIRQIALISLVDRYRQWFKSSTGLSTDETRRDISFCGHAILGDDVFEVRNAARDPRFADNPLVTGTPKIRFYAGAPLEVSNGHKLGTLCIIDQVPRQLSEDEKTMLKHLAAMVVQEIIYYVDTGTGLANQTALRAVVTRQMEALRGEEQLEMLLFKLTETLEDETDNERSIATGENFGRMLHENFTTALSIAHWNGSNYCVLVANDGSIDEARALDYACSSSLESLHPDSVGKQRATNIGRLNFNKQTHASAEAAMAEVDRLFMG